MNLAVGNGDGYVFMKAENESGRSHIANEGEKVWQVKLDNFIDKIDFLKIDTEGYELEVLKGAENLINKYHPAIFIEVNEPAVKWLWEHNYKGQIINRTGFVLEPIGSLEDLKKGVNGIFVHI